MGRGGGCGSFRWLLSGESVSVYADRLLDGVYCVCRFDVWCRALGGPGDSMKPLHIILPPVDVLMVSGKVSGLYGYLMTEDI